MSCLRRPFLLSYSNHDKSMKEDKVLQVYIPVSIHFTRPKTILQSKKREGGVLFSHKAERSAGIALHLSDMYLSRTIKLSVGHRRNISMNLRDII